MQTQEIFIPVYCNHCNQLAFIYKSDSSKEKVVLEFYKSIWSNHLCFNAKGEKIWSHHSDLPSIEWGTREIPIKFPNRTKKTRQTQLSLGIIVELPEITENDSKNAFYKVLTLESSIVFIRSVEKQEITSAGILIDLSNAKKIGTDKFRVPEIVRISPNIENGHNSKDNQSFFSFKLSANDQEQLESFVDRFLKTLSQNNLYLESITPLKIRPESSSEVYQRRLTVSSAYRLEKAIDTMTFPESIRISIQ